MYPDKPGFGRRGLVAAVVTLAGVAGAAAGGPALVMHLAAKQGVSVARAGWCRTGLCLHQVEAQRLRELTVAHVAVDWDRTVRLVGVEVSARGGPGGGAPAGDAGGDAGGDAAAAGALDWVRRVTVEDLRVRDLPLPSLSGEVYPQRHLRGDEFTLDGSVVETSMETPYGRIRLKADPAGGPGGPGGLPALRIEAEAAVLTAPEALLGEEFALHDVHAVGEYRNGTWSGTVGCGDLRVPAVVDVRASTVTATLDAVPMATLFRALAAAVPEGARAHILGTVSGTVTLHADGAVSTHVTSPSLDGFRVAGLVGDELRDRFTYAMLDATGEPSSRTTGPSIPGWTSLERIGPSLPAAVIAAEDATFSSHPGYDLQSMVDAAGENADLGKVRRGGSTLTQQLAKNLYLDGSRTYTRKLRELLYAVNLEGALGKREILETYLNIVEFGPGIYGCTMAADRYFLKSPSGLLPEEAAWLASILPSPRPAFHQQYERDRPNTARVRGILDNMVTLPLNDREAAKQRAIHFVH